MDENYNGDDGVAYHAGFPNAAEDTIGQKVALSLDKLVIKQPASTYFWRLDARGVPELGLRGGAILVVDKAKPAQHGDWVVMVINEEFVLRNIVRVDKAVRLFTPSGQPEKQKHAVLWGVVTYCLQTMHGASRL